MATQSDMNLSSSGDKCRRYRSA